jgi:hypothetical protein
MALHQRAEDGRKEAVSGGKRLITESRGLAKRLIVES